MSLLTLFEAEGVMEISKEFKIPRVMSLTGLFGALRNLTRTFDNVTFDVDGHPRDAAGNVMDYLGFTVVTNGHRTSISIYRSALDLLTVTLVPEVNHSCHACNTMWHSVRDMIYRYVNSWDRYTRRHKF